MVHHLHFEKSEKYYWIGVFDAIPIILNQVFSFVSSPNMFSKTCSVALKFSKIIFFVHEHEGQTTSCT